MEHRRPIMFATFIGDARVRRNDGSKDESRLQPGELVRVEVPLNCAVYSTCAPSAREIALSWFMAGLDAAGDMGDASVIFEKMWEVYGLVLDFDK